jgi:hypothetical protein
LRLRFRLDGKAFSPPSLLAATVDASVVFRHTTSAGIRSFNACGFTAALADAAFRAATLAGTGNILLATIADAAFRAATLAGAGNDVLGANAAGLRPGIGRVRHEGNQRGNQKGTSDLTDI